ncbi:MAG: Ig-like domain-containing protein [bacterium]
MQYSFRVMAVLAAMLLLVGCPGTDTTNPEITIVYPPNGAALDTGSIVIKALATDDKSVTKVEFYDGASKIGEDRTVSADTFDISWTATAGNHTLKAVASDGAGNTSEDAVQVTVTAGGGGGPTHHSGEITHDETWLPSGNPHIIDNDVYPGENVTLTIKPGCIIKFQPGTELYCGYWDASAIIAEGTADSVILFTSNVSTPAPGDWQSVGVYDLSMPTTSFKYCIFEYGGSQNYGTFILQKTGVKFSNCTVRKSADYGISVADDGYFKEFNNNTITECARFPLYIFGEYVRTIGTGNNFTGNTQDGILVHGDDIVTTGTWVNPGVPYVINGDINVGDNTTNPVLTISPGTTVKLQNDVEFYCGWDASGAIKADGTAGRIRFISSVPAPSRGDWQSLGFYRYTIDSEAKLINCTVEYGGGDGYGNIIIRDALPQISGDSIGHSAAYGIHLDGSEYPDPTELQNNNIFYDNQDGDIHIP